jgi:Transcription termination factor nusG
VGPSEEGLTVGSSVKVGSRAKKALALEGNERWFLVHTQPKSERKAELHLGAQGFRTHVPQIQKTIRHARQLRTVQAPLFPRYLFLILDLGRDRWRSVYSTIGVSSLFTCEDRPVPVPSRRGGSPRRPHRRSRPGAVRCRSHHGANSSYPVWTVCRFRGHA